jgi:hypothetical protein
MEMKKKKTVAGAAGTPSHAQKKTEQSLRVNFAEAEILAKGRKAAELSADLGIAENEKKVAVAQAKAKCERIASQIKELQGHINAGYEYRSVVCEIRYDTPEPGTKTTVRLDTGEVVERAEMTLGERQIELPIEQGGAVARRATEASGVVTTPGDIE